MMTKTRLKTFFLAAVLALVSSLAHAQPAPPVVRSVPLIVDYDLDATSYTFCTMLGEGQGAAARAIQSPRGSLGNITTSGSSTTTTSFTASVEVFGPLAVGDLIGVIQSNDVLWRYVTAKASASSITVDTAWDLEDTDHATGYQFFWRDRTCGTAATDGWFPVNGVHVGNFQIQVSQISVTGGIDYKVECKVDQYTASPVTIIGATNVTAVGYTGNVFYEPWEYCRVGLKIGSADDGSDTGADAEKVSVFFVGRTE